MKNFALSKALLAQEFVVCFVLKYNIENKLVHYCYFSSLFLIFVCCLVMAYSRFQ